MYMTAVYKNVNGDIVSYILKTAKKISVYLRLCDINTYFTCTLQKRRCGIAAPEWLVTLAQNTTDKLRYLP